MSNIYLQKVAIIGAGISGLSIAQMLTKEFEVKVFEKESKPGGLIKCERVNGNLFHRIGGHVFNSHRQDVLNWFWGKFNKDEEFNKTYRNASLAMSYNKMVPYPIENHIYHFDEKIQKSIIDDLIFMAKIKDNVPNNFEDFLVERFGKTLYELYFKPYNTKIWRRDLKKVPLSWLEGKLPMPTLQEIIYNNMNHVKERSFVHSSFNYPKQDGSQFIANRLSEGLNISYNTEVNALLKKGKVWIVNGESYDKIIFCGNIKQLPFLIKDQIDITAYKQSVEELEWHGTTTVFCEIEKNPYSWIYMPSKEYESHRIICTGNFSLSNSVEGKLTGTIEFTDAISSDGILENLSRIPFTPKYLKHHFEKYTYPIQSKTTKTMMNALKNELEKSELFLLGRFSEWEYYNMDSAIGAAIDLHKRLSV